MRLSGKHEYRLIAYGGSAIRICRFRKTGTKYKAIQFHESEFLPENPSESLKNALAECGGSASAGVIVCGPMQNGVIFRTSGSDLSVRDQKNALEFEVPLHMMQISGKPAIQYVRHTENDHDVLQVHSFPKDSLNSLAAILTGAKCRADEYVHPILGVRPGDPAVYLPSVESDFYFENGEWKAGCGFPGNSLSEWKSIVDANYVLPENFDLARNLDLILVMQLMSSPQFRREESGIAVLSNQLKPIRCRFQVILLIVLALILACGWLRGTLRERIRLYDRAVALTQERDNYRKKASSLKAQLKRSEKESKELARVTKLNAGDHDLRNKLYQLARILPQACLISSFRFNDGSMDLVIQSEGEEGNPAQALRKLPGWKVASLQQRNMGMASESVMMTMVRLEPDTGGGK